MFHRFILHPSRLLFHLPSLFMLMIISSMAHSQGSLPKDSPGDTIDVITYRIHLKSINIAGQSIDAMTRLTFTTPYSGVTSVPLELKDLTVDSVLNAGGYPLDFLHQADLLRITPGMAFSAGDTLTIEVHYHGIPYHEAWGGFHFSGNYAFNLGVGLSEIPHNLGKTWFPCIDDFTDRAIYEVLATVPDGIEAIAGGQLEEIIDHGDGTRTFHWRHLYSLPTYLVSLAVGDYTHVADTFQGMNGPVPIDIYVRPQDSIKVAGTFIHLEEILAIFETCMGPYPFERAGYTGTALGAMEHASNIFIPYSTISGNTSNESLMAHELSHMWVGDQVTCSSAEEMWLNEGWATFFGMYYALALYGDEQAFRDEMRAKHAEVLQFCHTPSGAGSYFPLNQIPQTHTYNTLAAYYRGATVTQALRFYLGDSLFFESLAAYLDAFAYNSASSYDMRDFLTGYTGIDMNGFFDNWVLHSGTPHYSIDSIEIFPEGEQYSVHVFPRQKRKGPAFTGTGNIMEVMFLGQDWQMLYDTLHFSGESGHSIRLLPFEPVAVLIDPLEKMCDATTDQVKALHSTGNYTYDKTFFQLTVEEIADSALVQVTHHWAAPDSMESQPEGLRLSDYRYWRIDGLFPDGFQSSGKFFYSQGSYLDNTLITGPQDSVVILYRKDASEPWSAVPFEKIGIWSVGNIIVQDLQPGDYTLAVWDTGVGLDDRHGGLAPKLKIFPNPSERSFQIKYKIGNDGNLAIYTTTGQRVYALALPRGENEVIWSPGILPAGTYLVCLQDDRQQQMESAKLVYRP